MPFSYFSFSQIIPLIIAIVLLTLAIVFFQKEKIKTSLVLIFLGAFAIGCFMALLDPFLHIWDEQYHALVAKNMMDNPFFPVLFKNPVLDYDYQVWTDNYVWLHKQPLFLWQIALSMKIFGVNEFSVRLPSIIMHAIIPLFIYRIGKISLDSKTGFFGALIFSLAYYPLELISGKYYTDHNDLAFLFYVTASFWSWFEYMNSKKNYWLILIGLFAGCAVLVKWLMGLLVYICWTFTRFTKRKDLIQWRSYIPLIKSFCISLLVFIPWQIYILYKFPKESSFEFSGFSDHFYNVVEGHEGNFWFHFEATQVLYGSGILFSLFLIVSLITLYRKINAGVYGIFIIGAILFVYLFYSFAATKIFSFCIIVSPFIYLGFSAFYTTVINFIKKKISRQWLQYILSYSLLILLCYFFISLNKIQANHTLYRPKENDNRKEKLAEKRLIDNLKNILPDNNYILFNTVFVQGGNIAFMFYGGYTAYHFIPTEEQVKTVEDKGYKVAVIDFGNLPDYLKNDDDILKIPVSK
jgi:4-amino-4-deoxy-L-arabinose transferase-like glycosyltransferase